MTSTTDGSSVPVFTGIWKVELPMVKEPVAALMGAGFLKQGFVNVMATRAFQDSTTRGLDSTDGSMFDLIGILAELVVNLARVDSTRILRNVQSGLSTRSAGSHGKISRLLREIRTWGVSQGARLFISTGGAASHRSESPHAFRRATSSV